MTVYGLYYGNPITDPVDWIRIMCDYNGPWYSPVDPERYGLDITTAPSPAKHACGYCGGHTVDDSRGNCAACGGPRSDNRTQGGLLPESAWALTADEKYISRDETEMVVRYAINIGYIGSESAGAKFADQLLKAYG